MKMRRRRRHASHDPLWKSMSGFFDICGSSDECKERSGSSGAEPKTHGQLVPMMLHLQSGANQDARSNIEGIESVLDVVSIRPAVSLQLRTETHAICHSTFCTPTLLLST